jgi:hypothetical protein
MQNTENGFVIYSIIKIKRLAKAMKSQGHISEGIWP